MKDLTTQEIIKELLSYIQDDNTENDDFKALLSEAQSRVGSDNLKKSLFSEKFEELDNIFDKLEKGGEGSKGGKVIGHTRSGKPIYDSYNHPSHKNFSGTDHREAADLHSEKVDHYMGKYNTSNNDSHYEKANKHGDNSDKHMSASRNLF